MIKTRMKPATKAGRELATATELKGSAVKKVLDSCGHQGGEEVRQVHHPWLGHDQDSHEACDESGQEGGLRQSCHGQSQASYESCQGFLRGGVEEEHLSHCHDLFQGCVEHICGSFHKCRALLMRG